MRALATLVALALAPSSSAEEVCHTDLAAHFHQTGTLELPGFDAGLGCLTSVRITFAARFEGGAGLENLGSDTKTVDASWRNRMRFDLSGERWALLEHGRPIDLHLPPYDGTTDFRGLSGKTFDNLTGDAEWSVDIGPQDLRFSVFLGQQVRFDAVHEALGLVGAPEGMPTFHFTSPSARVTVCYRYAAVERYCLAGPNSTGTPARISWSGSTSVGVNSFELRAGPVPYGERGFFVYSPDQADLPMGYGRQCVGDTTLGFVLRLTPVVAGPDELLVFLVDLTAPPHPTGLVEPGSTWNFQAWYRDVAAGFPRLNSSDGLRVSFCP